MADDPQCANGGYLVGMELPIPGDASQRYVGGGDFVGCNRIFCPSCQSWVRHVDRRQLGAAPRTSEDHRWLYDHLSTVGAPMIVSDEKLGSDVSRVYACRCSADDCGSLLRIASRENEWRCAGHPTPNR